ncbi:MAG: hypothetical protein K2Y37_11875 [Pirellulales bacterium]|nr:hypothetical protein [Pirellulales bacterium]
MWFLLVILSVPVTAVTARWVLAPMLRSVERQRVDRQYSVLDLAYFFLMFSAASMLLRNFYLQSEGWEAIVAMMLVFPFVAAVWWLSLSCLNGRGIRGAWRRAVFSVVVTPMAFVGPITAYGAAAMLLLRPLLRAQGALANRLLADTTGQVLALTILLRALAALLFARLASSWVARAALGQPGATGEPLATALADDGVKA